eukprot:403355788
MTSKLFTEQQGFLSEVSFEHIPQSQAQGAITKRYLEAYPNFVKSMYSVNETTYSAASQLSIVFYVQSSYPLIAPITLSISIPQEFDVLQGSQTCQLSYQVLTQKTETQLQCQVNQGTIQTTLQQNMIFDSYQQIILTIDSLFRNPKIIGSNFPDISVQIQSKYSNLTLTSQSQQIVTSIQATIQATMRTTTFTGNMINDLLLTMTTNVDVPSNSQTTIQFPNDWIVTEAFSFGTLDFNSSYKSAGLKTQLILKPKYPIKTGETIAFNISGIILPRHQLQKGIEQIKIIFSYSNNTEFQHGYADISQDVQSRFLPISQAYFQLSYNQQQTPLILIVSVADFGLGSDSLEVFFDDAVSIDTSKLKTYQENETAITSYFIENDRKLVIKLDKVQIEQLKEQRFKIVGLAAPYSTKPSIYKTRLVDFLNREVGTQQKPTYFQNDYQANFTIILLSSSSTVGTYTNLTFTVPDDVLIYRNATLTIQVPSFLSPINGTFEVYQKEKQLQAQILNGTLYLKVSKFTGFPLSIRNLKINKPTNKYEPFIMQIYNDDSLEYKISKNLNRIILGLNCSSQCQSCYYEDNTQCLSCQDGKNLYNQSCIPECPLRYFSLKNVCYKCSSNCSQCSEKADQCLACNEQFFFYQGECLSSCPIRTIEDPINLKCQNCPSLCKKCDKSLACQECQQGSQLKNGYCYDCRPENGYTYDYVNQTCIPLIQDSNMEYHAIFTRAVAVAILLVICTIIHIGVSYKLGANFRDCNYLKTFIFKSNYLSCQVVLGVIRIILQLCIVIMGGDIDNALLVLYYQCARFHLRLIYFYIVKGTNSVGINMLALFVKVQIVDLYYYQDLRCFLMGRNSINERETIWSKIMQAGYFVIDAAIVNIGHFLIAPDPKITAYYYLLTVDCYMLFLGCLGLKPIILLITGNLFKKQNKVN